MHTLWMVGNLSNKYRCLSCDVCTTDDLRSLQRWLVRLRSLPQGHKSRHFCKTAKYGIKYTLLAWPFVRQQQQQICTIFISGGSFYMICYLVLNKVFKDFAVYVYGSHLRHLTLTVWIRFHFSDPWSFHKKLSRAMRKCVLCHMRTTMAQISLRIRTVWSAPLLFAA